MHTILTVSGQRSVNVIIISIYEAFANNLTWLPSSRTFIGMNILGLDEVDSAGNVCLGTLNPNPTASSFSSRVYANEDGRENPRELLILFELEAIIDFFNLDTANDSFLLGGIGCNENIASIGFVSNSFIAAPIPPFTGTKASTEEILALLLLFCLSIKTHAY
jgi:hypothetical protein